MKFRKKPVVIDAFQMTKERVKSNSEWPKWLHEARKKTPGESGCLYFDASTQEQIFISTLEGDLTVSHGDWIIRGIQGEIYPCKPDIFEQCYEKVDAG